MKFNSWRPILYSKLVDLIADHAWFRPIKVASSGFETTEDDLVHFLQRHRASLSKLHPDLIYLAVGEWPH